MSYIALSSATELGEKVYGTSALSKYGVVALGDFNVATRFKNNALSIRIEGGKKPITDFPPDMITLLGLTSIGTTHISTHVQAPDSNVAMRVWGSVVAVLHCKGMVGEYTFDIIKYGG